MEIKLTGRMRKLANYFYHYYRIVLRRFAFPKFEQERGLEGSKGSLSDTDSDNISHEHNEAMDIDALISGSGKRRRTST
ncbi:hypothetical protein GOBAR_DD31949 [Gossypium barbadense]|nr:hypothetical protein GOBAR_DD31949 [Gossypium barbadense]